MADARPLRILALLSEPLVDADGDPIPRLDLHAAAERVRQQLGAIDRAATLRFVPAIPNDVLNALRDFGPFDLLHFYGHGDKGVLAFEDGRGGIMPINQTHLHSLFAPGGRPAPPVALVSACHSGSMAEALFAAGVGPVVAVDTEASVLDVAARAFAAQFYPELLSGQSVRQAFDTGCVMVLNDTDVRTACQHLVESQPDYQELIKTVGLQKVVEARVQAEVRKFRLLPEPEEGQPDPHQAAPFADAPRGKVEVTDLPRPPETIPTRPDYFTGRETDLHDVIESVLD